MYQNGNAIKNNAKVAVITGSSRGIGKAIAKEFAKNGYSIVINARDEGELDQTFNEIKNTLTENSNNKIFSVVGDISKEDVCKRLIAETINKFGKIDVLVNNAGIGGTSKKTSELSVADWTR
jgi:NAD(P)-dependent dehydrogenase (short-subunit alcohol dehydrogenase family)